MEKLWTTSEVAKFLRINEVDVEELVRQGKLTGYKLGGKFLRFRPDQVEELKSQIRFRPGSSRPAPGRNESWFSQCREFIYFYDFYVVSASLLVLLLVYLIVVD